VITGDLDAALGPGAGTAGTWRPAPPGMSARPGTYATPAAFRTAHGRGAGPAAAALAARLTRLDWVETAGVTGDGYLTVTVTATTLARLAVRITQAGPACAHSRILAGITVSAPPAARLEPARGWEEARRRLAAATTARLAEAAGARVVWRQAGDSSRRPPPGPASQGQPRPARAEPGPWDPGGGRAPASQGVPEGSEADPTASQDGGGVAAAIGFAGIDAVTFALARLASAGPAGVDLGGVAAHRLSNPAYAVRYAHARAASTLRQAADLGLGIGDAAGFQPRLLAQPRELSLLYELSWLPERVAGAARRGRPDVLARHLERVAGAYLGCQERHPAVWPGMPPGGTPATVPRLWLAAAVRTALAAGLGLLGVTAPDRL
jgi:arginyl-tRNA synthetase